MHPDNYQKLTHPSLINLINQTLLRIPEVTHGTYNKQDPTAFSKGHIDTLYKGDSIDLSYHDVTWGNELTIMINDKEIGSFYLTWDQTYNGKHWVTTESVIPRQKTKGLIKLLYLINQELEIIPEPDYSEDPYGCLSDYE